MLAIGGAAAVTVVTISGGLGIGPVAALASPTRTPPESSAAPSASESAPSASSSADRSSGGGWLTVEKPAERADGSGDDTSDDTGDSRGGAAVPPGPGGDPAAPSIPTASGHGKRIVFDQSDQRVWLVDGKGRLARTYLVSGSIHDNLSPGSYDVYSKSRHAVSFDGRETMRFMVRFTQGRHAAIGFHDIPRRPNGALVETRDQLGTPLSAGCIRQWEPDAKALWRFAPVGTKVVVVA